MGGGGGGGGELKTLLFVCVCGHFFPLPQVLYTDCNFPTCIDPDSHVFSVPLISLTTPLLDRRLSGIWAFDARVVNHNLPSVWGTMTVGH